MPRIQSLTLESLLAEMNDGVSLSRIPDPGYRITHQSSYDRASVSPQDPEGWFANQDHGSFLRKERNRGREECVIAEFDGPGSLCRIWTPDRRIMPRHDKRIPEETVVRLYLDGEGTPAVEGLFQDLFNGRGLFPGPFAHPSLSSAVSYFPVPFRKGCKVTLEGEPYFYNISARMYGPGTRVESFSPGQMQALSEKIRRTGELLLAPAPPSALRTNALLEATPGGTSTVALPDGPRAILDLSLSLVPAEGGNPGALRGSILRISFDGVETVFCPIGDFFGCGPGSHPFRSLTRNVEPDGTMRCRWAMPYRGRAEVAVLNLDEVPHVYALEVGTSESSWDSRSMHFHAGWRYSYPIHTRPYSDWNYLTVDGEGRYVGDTLTVYNPVKNWWGEGDEKVWVDEERFPSIFGTGTEDYYGYSWGGGNRAFYEHPMHAQVRVGPYDKLRREPMPTERNTQGISTEIRNLVLDSVTFGHRLKYDMEIWHTEECDVAYAAACFWYGAPGAASNAPADPDRVRASMRDLPLFESGVPEPHQG